MQHIYLFEVTEQHIALLRRMSVRWEMNQSNPNHPGAPAINRYRTYGNSNFLGDLAEILGVPQPDYEKGETYSKEQKDYLYSMHRQTEWALQCALTAGCMEPGVYGSPWPDFCHGQTERLSDEKLLLMKLLKAEQPHNYRFTYLDIQYVSRHSI